MLPCWMLLKAHVAPAGFLPGLLGLLGLLGQTTHPHCRCRFCASTDASSKLSTNRAHCSQRSKGSAACASSKGTCWRNSALPRRCRAAYRSTHGKCCHSSAQPQRCFEWGYKYKQCNLHIHTQCPATQPQHQQWARLT